MKRVFFTLTVLLLAISSFAQVTTTRDWASQWRYEDANDVLASIPYPGRVVFMGNSITDLWLPRHPEFFAENGFICRGISGQTTPQMLLRFRQDVVRTGASAVVILAGTNDIAGNTGDCTLEEIVGNIAGMCEIAKANGVRVLLCSVLPVHQYPWAKKVKAFEEIPKLNALLKEYARENGITYVDFFSAMVDSALENINGLSKDLAEDGVHPIVKGYQIMERVVLNELKDEVAAYMEAHKEVKLKLMSYNVKSGNGMDHKNWYYRRTAEVINSVLPDVVAVQELDSVTARSGGKYVLGQMAYLTGMYPTYAPAIDYDGGKYGIGMLSREKPLETKQIKLPGREEERTLLLAEFSGYIYCCTHLSLTEADRIESVKILKKEIKKFAKRKSKPLFLAGDWNDTPDSKVLAMMMEDFEILNDPMVMTCPADVPEFTIDYIARWKGSPKGVLDGVVSTIVGNAARTSDHRPVIVELK